MENEFLLAEGVGAGEGAGVKNLSFLFGGEDGVGAVEAFAKVKNFDSLELFIFCPWFSFGMGTIFHEEKCNKEKKTTKKLIVIF